MLAGVTTSLTLAAFALAGPAAANVPEGFSDPEAVDPLHLLALLVGIPVGLALVIVVLVYAPALARGERVAPGAPEVEDQWLGGRRSAAELAAPEAAQATEAESGGASGRW